MKRPHRLRLSRIDAALLISVALYAGLSLLRMVSRRYGWGVENLVSWRGLFIGLFADLLLLRLCRSVLRAAGIRLDRGDTLLYIGVTLGLLGYCAYSLSVRRFLCGADSACYYFLQWHLNGLTDMLGMPELARAVYNSFTWEYNLFLPVFFEGLFTLTNQTHGAYVLAVWLWMIPTVMLMLLAFVKKLGVLLGVRRPRLFVTLGYLTLSLMPMLYGPALLGQPDLMGLLFALCVLLLTLDCRLERWEPGRMIALWVSVLGVILSRRWYAFGLIGYLGVYALWLLLDAARRSRERWKTVLTCTLPYALLSAGLMAAALYPMLSAYLSQNYARSYAFYLGGGFAAEFASQAGYLGYGYVAIALLGLAAAMFRPGRRRFALMAAGGWIIATYGFTRIQNMGVHQALLEMPFVWLALLLGAAAVSDLTRPAIRGALTAGMGLLIAANAAVTVLSDAPPTGVTANVSVKPVVMDYYDPVFQVDAWLLENSEPGGAYMISHGGFGFPDQYRYALAPDFKISDILPYGSAIAGSHAFPTGLLTARYVLTTEPFCNLSIAYKYNDVFLTLAAQGVFRPVKTFDFGQGREMRVYERIRPADRAEVEAYRAALTEENKTYPELYAGVLDQFEAQLNP